MENQKKKKPQLTSAGICSSSLVYLWTTLSKSFGKYPKIRPTYIKRRGKRKTINQNSVQEIL